MITGHTPGHMIEGWHSRDSNLSDFTECPECGEQMAHDAKRCRDCHLVEKQATLDAIERAERQERQELFALALQAGWTVEDLYGGKYEPGQKQKDRLPTRQEIVERMIGKWWKGKEQ